MSSLILIKAKFLHLKTIISSFSKFSIQSQKKLIKNIIISFNIIAILMVISFAVYHQLSWKIYKRKVLKYQKTIPGWCSQEKTSKIMDLIHKTHPFICVEIGVFCGSSAYPMAAALAFENQGMLYAIDPWVAEAYKDIDLQAAWWKEINFEHALKKFTHILYKKKLVPFCQIIRMNSYQAADYFKDESIDILHIDGNYSEQLSFSDVKTYLPKVKKNGYILFEKANWHYTKKSFYYLMQHCSLNINYSIGNSCYLFRKKS